MDGLPYTIFLINNVYSIFSYLYFFWVFVLFHTILQVVSLNYNRSWSALLQCEWDRVSVPSEDIQSHSNLVCKWVWQKFSHLICLVSLLWAVTFKNCKTMFDWCVTDYTSAAIKKYLWLGYGIFALMHWKHLTLMVCFKRQNAYQKHHEVCRTALMI